MDREGKNTYYVIRGKLIIFVKDRLLNIDGEVSFSDPISDIWDDVLPNDLHNEGGVSFRKGKKPEKLIQRILQFGSNEYDIILDYHLGSGTTAAVAHKMRRRYIGVEQMDYGENGSVVRLQNTIGRKVKDGSFDKVECDQSGISKAVNWQGGGEFVYCELAKANQTFVDEILAATDKKGLMDIWGKMQNTGFLSWKVDLKTIDENATDFDALSVEDTKRFLIEALDKNLLYIPYSEIENKEYKISERDKKLNRQFYGKA